MIFHLAIPTHNLHEAENFYLSLGCNLARKYNDRITLNFFNHQLVCHLSPENVNLEGPLSLYPRHFGMTFDNEIDFQSFIELLEKNTVSFYKQPFIRFEGKKEEHITFFLKDPSNNLLEFKHYNNISMIY